MSQVKKYDFTNKVALVTGSSSGIGAAIAIQLAQYGAQVAITGRDTVNLEKVAQQVRTASQTEPLQLIGNLTDEEFVHKLIDQTVAKFGRLDVLVNNAGAGSIHGALADPQFLEAFDQIMALNVRSVALLIHLAVPHLEVTGGNIINISSIAGIRPMTCVYSTSKAALDMLTQTAAQELAQKKIRVNSVNPGPVWTAFGRSVGNENIIKDLEPVFAGKNVRVADPMEIANLTSFLASSDASNINGAIVVSDGGTMVANPLM